MVGGSARHTGEGDVLSISDVDRGILSLFTSTYTQHLQDRQTAILDKVLSDCEAGFMIARTPFIIEILRILHDRVQEGQSRFLEILSRLIWTGAKPLLQESSGDEFRLRGHIEDFYSQLLKLLACDVISLQQITVQVFLMVLNRERLGSYERDKAKGSYTSGLRPLSVEVCHQILQNLPIVAVLTDVLHSEVSHIAGWRPSNTSEEETCVTPNTAVDMGDAKNRLGAGEQTRKDIMEEELRKKQTFVDSILSLYVELSTQAHFARQMLDQRSADILLYFLSIITHGKDISVTMVEMCRKVVQILMSINSTLLANDSMLSEGEDEPGDFNLEACPETGIMPSGSRPAKEMSKAGGLSILRTALEQLVIVDEKSEESVSRASEEHCSDKVSLWARPSNIETLSLQQKELRTEILVLIHLLCSSSEVVDYVIAEELADLFLYIGAVDAHMSRCSTPSERAVIARVMGSTSEQDMQLLQISWLIAGQCLVHEVRCGDLASRTQTTSRLATFCSVILLYCEGRATHCTHQPSSQCQGMDRVHAWSDYQFEALQQNALGVLRILSTTITEHLLELDVQSRVLRAMTNTTEPTIKASCLDILAAFAPDAHCHDFFNEEAVLSEVYALLKEEDVDVAVRCRALRFLSAVCSVDGDSKRVRQDYLRKFGLIALLVQALVKAAREMEPIPVYADNGQRLPQFGRPEVTSLFSEIDRREPTAGEKSGQSEKPMDAGLVLASLDLIQIAIIGNKRSEAKFLNENGLDALFSCLESLESTTYAQLLRIVSELCQNQRALPPFKLWRSDRTGINPTELLLLLWRWTEAKQGIVRGPSGEVLTSDETGMPQAPEIEDSAGASEQQGQSMTEDGLEHRQITSQSPRRKSAAFARLQEALSAGSSTESSTMLPLTEQEARSICEEDMRPTLFSILEHVGLVKTAQSAMPGADHSPSGVTETLALDEIHWKLHAFDGHRELWRRMEALCLEPVDVDEIMIETAIGDHIQILRMIRDEQDHVIKESMMEERTEELDQYRAMMHREKEEERAKELDRLRLTKGYKRPEKMKGPEMARMVKHAFVEHTWNKSPPKQNQSE